MIATVVHELDNLVERGEITGYTYEPEPAYLTTEAPTLTYSMYDSTQSGLGNLRAFAADMTSLGAHLATHRTTGSVAVHTGATVRIHRSSQVTVRATFLSVARLSDGVRLVSRHYLASSGSNPRAASWRIPDVRISGVRGIDGAIDAFAHTAPFDAGAVVVLSLGRRPPLPGMTSHAVHLLPVWRNYLQVS
ncbi:MAG TPA: hypothetical protein VNV65_09990 [Candidatus Solibacter sp.]|nr:hypothetical protein [Candidatus Solibacter sp.]